MDFDWKKIVKTVAPTIASVFGTPLAGMGVTAILDAILPEGEARPSNPEAYLSKILAGANPEVMLKLKEAEQNFALNIKKLDIDLEKFLEQLEVESVKDARDLKRHWLGTGKFDYEPILAGLVCIAFGYAEWWVFNYASAETAMNADHAVLVGRILGSVESAFILLLSFRWGTSHGSKMKDETLDRIVNHKEDGKK